MGRLSNVTSQIAAVLSFQTWLVNLSIINSFSTELKKRVVILFYSFHTISIILVRTNRTQESMKTGNFTDFNTYFSSLRASLNNQRKLRTQTSHNFPVVLFHLSRDVYMAVP